MKAVGTSIAEQAKKIGIETVVFEGKTLVPTTAMARHQKIIEKKFDF